MMHTTCKLMRMVALCCGMTLCFACGKRILFKEDVLSRIVADQYHAKPDVVLLADELHPDAWTEMLVFPPYSNVESLNIAAPIKNALFDTRIQERDDICVVVFSGGPGEAEIYIEPRRKVDFSELTKTSYQKKESVAFSIAKDDDGCLKVKPLPPWYATF